MRIAEMRSPNALCKSAWRLASRRSRVCRAPTAGKATWK
ncbi:UNVERIFIED_CONTAM: hypothetical protein GTU68_057519 [Idotea baltica]|nr:hypothetical protein [Idotea baltica]